MIWYVNPKNRFLFVFHFFWETENKNWMEYRCGDSFPLDFKPNAIKFGSNSKGNPSSQSSSIPFAMKPEISFSECSDIYTCPCIILRCKIYRRYILYIYIYQIYWKYMCIYIYIYKIYWRYMFMYIYI